MSSQDIGPAMCWLRKVPSVNEFFSRFAGVVMHHQPLALSLLIDIRSKSRPREFPPVLHLVMNLLEPDHSGA